MNWLSKFFRTAPEIRSDEVIDLQKKGYGDTLAEAIHNEKVTGTGLGEASSEDEKVTIKVRRVGRVSR